MPKKRPTPEQIVTLLRQIEVRKQGRSFDPGRPNVLFAAIRSFQAHFADTLEGWGKALYCAGKKDEAHNQFATAAQLCLMEADKAELAG